MDELIMDDKSSTLNIEEVKQVSIKSMKWTFFAQIASKLITPLIMLILVAILSPDDFGLIGIAMIAISLSQSILDFGFEKALIQRQDQINESANVIFWTNLLIGIVLYMAIFLAAPFAATLFGDPRVTPVLQVLCLQIVLFSLTKVHLSLMQRNFEYKKIFIIQTATSLIPIFTTIPLALMGYGVWSLVAGTLMSALAQMVLCWTFSMWRPGLSFDFGLFRELFNFGYWVTIEVILGWLIVEGDSLILGIFFGVTELGIYRTGITLIKMIFDLIFTPIVPVLFSSFSRLQDDASEFKLLFAKINEIIAIVSLPTGFGLILTAIPISALVFGNRYDGIDIVIAIIGLTYSIAWLVGINSTVYVAMGKPKLNAILMLVTIAYYLPVYILAAPMGLLVFCIARLGVSILAIPLHLYLVHRYIGLPFTYIFDSSKKPLLASTIMGLLVFASSIPLKTYQGITGWVELIMLISIGVISYSAIIYVLDKKYALQLFGLVRKVIG